MSPTPGQRQRLARLAALMNERRLDLGERWEDIAAAGGPSIKTLREIRNGQGGIPRDLTLRRIDDGMRWVPGSAARVLDGGGDPEPLPVAPARPGDDAVSDSLGDDWQFLREWIDWWNKLTPAEQDAERRRIRGEGEPGNGSRRAS
jgi:hypothetical protein